jgi:hypothetical protein
VDEEKIGSAVMTPQILQSVVRERPLEWSCKLLLSKAFQNGNNWNGFCQTRERIGKMRNLIIGEIYGA